ncbi:MAG: queuosine salvage family protein [Myxococcota bacterium]|nr:queuosine salvage family protein [Myxococcota bacterium]
MGLFETIRRACATVAERARWVRIDEAGLAAFAEGLVGREQSLEAEDPAHHRREDDASTLAFVLTLDAVNFGSGWFPHMQKRPGASGYFTVATCLAEHFDENGALDPAALAQIEADECAGIFGQPSAPSEISPLMELFAQSWRDLGNRVQGSFGGSFAGLVEAADHRAEGLVEILGSMPLYRDVEDYDGLEVPFYKRAQITCTDLATAFEGSGPGRFDDLDELTIFADNLVPHVLRWEGVLDYAPDLLGRIDAEERIALGSAEEIEIRAVALHAVERLSAEMGKVGEPMPPRRLDALLWHRGQNPEIKASPRHRTCCSYY